MLSQKSHWEKPDLFELDGTHVRVSRLHPDEDIDDLFEVSHATEQLKRVWTYMSYGPFPGKSEMLAWLHSVKESSDPRYYTVFSKSLQKKVGMYSILNVQTAHGRAELGHIWYSRLVQKTIVNTETTFLFLRYLFDELAYRRVEWKCDNRNEPSKYAALRLGFSFEGVFRSHMVVKGQNRDTAWFSLVDSEWGKVKGDYLRYFANPNLSLTKLLGRNLDTLPGT